MKILSKAFLFCSLAFYLSACTKSETTEDLLIPNSGNIAAANAINAVDSVSAALINRDWKYFEYYTAYNTTAPKLSYKDGRTSNALNLKPITVRYNQDLTYTETTAAGTTLSGTWSLTSNRTVLNIFINGQTFSSNIILLDGVKNIFRWQALDGGVPGGNHGVMMTTMPKTDTTKTLTQMLTANKWKYDIYYYYFTQPTSDIIYGTPAPPRIPYNLVTVEYKADHTFTESTPNSSLTGTWSLNGNQVTLVYPANGGGGTFVNTIAILQTGRLEMKRANDAVLDSYFRMIPAN